MLQGQILDIFDVQKCRILMLQGQILGHFMSIGVARNCLDICYGHLVSCVKLSREGHFFVQNFSIILCRVRYFGTS